MVDFEYNLTYLTLTIICFLVGNTNSINAGKIPGSKPTTANEAIRFNQAGKLKIVNIADLHYGEGPETDWGPLHDAQSTNATTSILSWEKPDFVVFTGDQVTGEDLYPNVTAYIDMLVQPLVDGGYKWASVYGNHDVGPNVTRHEILAAEQKYSLCYTQQGLLELPGVTNYYLQVLPPVNESSRYYDNREGQVEEKPAMIWWFFDSRGGRDGNGQIPEYIDEKVVTWFRWQHKQINDTWGEIPALAFFHIPTSEYANVQQDISNNPKCTGLIDDDVTAQDMNTGLLNALVEAGTVKTTFVGHDHGNA